MILSWGKPTIKKAISTLGAPGSVWEVIDTPKEDTTQLNTTAGDNVEAKEEGGDLVDVIYKKNTYALEFDIFVKKGKALPFNDVDGVVAGEYAFQIIPEDDACVGIQIDRSTVRVETSYTSADGILQHVTITPLKPASGTMIKLQTNGTAPGSNGVSLNEHTLTLANSGTATLTANQYPSTATVVWSTTDSTIATVSSGTVTAASSGTGTCAIIASIVVDGVVYTDSCIVSVVTTA